jgi:hypothetical protein
MANWALAGCHEVDGFSQRACTFRKTIQMSLVAASSLGKWPRHPHRSADLRVRALDGIGGVEDFAQLRRKREERY